MEKRPTNEVKNREMKQDVAEKFRTVFGLEETPETLGEWADNTVGFLEGSGVSVGFEEMCTTGSSRHTVHVDGETQHFQCVLDTLLYPFVLDEASEVKAESRSPVSEEVVEIKVSQEGVEVEPEDAVMSFGTAEGVSAVDKNDDALEYGYRMFCPYINAFTDEGEYKEWESETQEAATMALTFEEGFGVARILGEKLGE